MSVDIKHEMHALFFCEINYSGPSSSQCNTIKQASVIMGLYDSIGKKVDTNVKNKQIYKGFREDLEKGKGYFFYVLPYNDADIGKPFTVQVLTQ